jgi:NADH:ubiquinone oxidoreductase subunit 6 (subunit J)
MALTLVGSRLASPGATGAALPPGSNTKALGVLLYTDYVYPF